MNLAYSIVLWQNEAAVSRSERTHMIIWMCDELLYPQRCQRNDSAAHLFIYSLYIYIQMSN